MNEEPPRDRKDRLGKIIDFAFTGKRQMLDKQVTRASKTCPECGARVHFVLAGRRNHLHMACETPGCHMRLME